MKYPSVSSGAPPFVSAQSEAVVRFARLRRVFLLDPCQGQAKKTTGWYIKLVFSFFFVAYFVAYG